MKMDKHSIASVMMCLQKSLLTEQDIVPMLEDLDFTLSEGLLTCINSPRIDLSETANEELKQGFKNLSVEEIETIKKI